MTKAITINIDEKTEQNFRKTAKMAFGKKKGYLGKALVEALKMWTELKKSDANAHALSVLEHGFNLGSLKTRDRGDWHARKPFL
jgi:hypothetical protein